MSKSKKKRSLRKTVTSFTLLAEALQSGRKEECLMWLAAIYVYLCRRRPPGPLIDEWGKEIRIGRRLKCTGFDFFIKGVGNYRKYGRCYYIQVRNDDPASPEAFMSYGNGAHSTDIGGKTPFVKRAQQLMRGSRKID